MKEMKNAVRTTAVNFICQFGTVTLLRYLFKDFSRCFYDLVGVRTIFQLMDCEEHSTFQDMSGPHLIS